MKKVAVLIAAGSGMGADAAKCLAEDGFKIAIMSSSGKGKRLAKKLGGIGFTGSNLDPKTIEKFINLVFKTWGRIDVLVNSAGHGPKGNILEITDEEWFKGVETYFLNVVRAIRIVTPIMKKQKSGSIINISTYAVFEPEKSFPTSGVIRASLSSFVKLYSDEYALSNTYDFKKWYKLPNEMVTSFNIYGGIVQSLNGEDVRITNRNFLPRNKLKGFNTRNIGPVDNTDYVGGNYAAAINFDTTLPMVFQTLENVDLRYFVDVANLWGVDYSSSVDQSNTIRSSTGFVVDWFTPIGPLNFSLSQDLSKAPDDRTESFQFNLGTTF